jgi:t-SNARE complex subunit (syntaxin)
MVRQEVDPPGKYYQVVEAVRAFRQARLKRAWTALAIVLIIAVVLIYFSLKM